MLAVRYASVAIKGCRYDQVGATSCRPKIWSMFSCSRSNCKYSRKDMRFLCILTTDMGGMESSNTCIMLDIGGLVLHLFLAKPPIFHRSHEINANSLGVPQRHQHLSCPTRLHQLAPCPVSTSKNPRFSHPIEKRWEEISAPR